MTATIAELPLSLTQRYFLGVIAEEGYDPTWQHVCMSVHTARELDPARVADVVSRLEARHPLLATRLAYRDGEPCLRNCSGSGRACQVLEVREASDAELGLCVSHHVDAPFDLFRGPLWRLVMARGRSGRTVLVFVCHHLVGDSVSTWVLLKDFATMYFGGDLDAESEPYSEFVRAERELLDGARVEDRLRFWQEALDGAEPRLRVARRPRTDQVGAADVLPIACLEGTGAGLLSTARQLRVTPLSLLAGATFAAVERATGQDDVLAAMVTDTRGPRFSRTVGAFSDLMFVRDRRPANGGDEGRLAALRNAFFTGWNHYLPVAFLRDRLRCFRTGVTVATNPCDVYVNFIPVKSSANWWDRVAPFRDDTLNYYWMPDRHPSPTRRMVGPLYFFSYLQLRELEGTIVAHRHEAVEELNRRVVAETELSLRELIVPPA